MDKIKIADKEYEVIFVDKINFEMDDDGKYTTKEYYGKIVIQKDMTTMIIINHDGKTVYDTIFTMFLLRNILDKINSLESKIRNNWNNSANSNITDVEKLLLLDKLDKLNVDDISKLHEEGIIKI